MSPSILGVDIGGRGMKAALVDVDHGQLVSERVRVATPRPATPQAMASVFDELQQLLGGYRGSIGCTFPGVVHSGATVRTAANLDPGWLDVDAAALLGSDDCPVVLINDADAAGLAEVRHGAGRDVSGVVVVVTIGTGLGTAVFTDGALVPNTEFGHLEIDGVVAETRAAGRVVKDEGLPLDAWAGRFERYLSELESLLWPDLFVLGGGISSRFEEWAPLIDVRTPLRPAALRNQAGIVGAAMVAAESGG